MSFSFFVISIVQFKTTENTSLKQSKKNPDKREPIGVPPSRYSPCYIRIPIRVTPYIRVPPFTGVPITVPPFIGLPSYIQVLIKDLSYITEDHFISCSGVKIGQWAITC